MPAAMTIIAMPPDVSKYFRNSIGSPFSASAHAPGFDRDRLTGKDQAEDLAEDQFFDQQCDSEREGHSCDDCDSCDCELHKVLRSTSLFFTALRLPALRLLVALGQLPEWLLPHRKFRRVVHRDQRELELCRLR